MATELYIIKLQVSDLLDNLDNWTFIRLKFWQLNLDYWTSPHMNWNSNVKKFSIQKFSCQKFSYQEFSCQKFSWPLPSTKDQTTELQDNWTLWHLNLSSFVISSVVQKVQNYEFFCKYQLTKVQISINIRYVI